MRCDGLPDPVDLRQLNAYHYRWLETSANTEPSIDRLQSRAPELNQVDDITIFITRSSQYLLIVTR